MGEKIVLETIDIKPYDHKYTRSSKAIMLIYSTIFYRFLLMHEWLHWAVCKLLNIDVGNDILADEVGATIDIKKPYHQIPSIKLICVGLAPLLMVPLAISFAWLYATFEFWMTKIMFAYLGIGCYLLARPSIGDLSSPFMSLRNSDTRSFTTEPVGASLAFILFCISLPLLALDLLDSRTGIVIDILFLKAIDPHAFHLYKKIGFPTINLVDLLIGFV